MGGGRRGTIIATGSMEPWVYAHAWREEGESERTQWRVSRQWLIKSPMSGICGVYRSRGTRAKDRIGRENRDKPQPIFNDDEILFIWLIINGYGTRFWISKHNRSFNLFSRI